MIFNCSRFTHPAKENSVVFSQNSTPSVIRNTLRRNLFHFDLFIGQDTHGESCGSEPKRKQAWVIALISYDTESQTMLKRYRDILDILHLLRELFPDKKSMIYNEIVWARLIPYAGSIHYLQR